MSQLNKTMHFAKSMSRCILYDCCEIGKLCKSVDVVNALYFRSRIAHMLANLCVKFCTMVLETYFVSALNVLREMTTNKRIIYCFYFTFCK